MLSSARTRWRENKLGLGPSCVNPDFSPTDVWRQALSFDGTLHVNMTRMMFISMRSFIVIHQEREKTSMVIEMNYVCLLECDEIPNGILSRCDIDV